MTKKEYNKIKAMIDHHVQQKQKKLYAIATFLASIALISWKTNKPGIGETSITIIIAIISILLCWYAKYLPHNRIYHEAHQKLEKGFTTKASMKKTLEEIDLEME